MLLSFAHFDFEIFFINNLCNLFKININVCFNFRVFKNDKDKNLWYIEFNHFFQYASSATNSIYANGDFFGSQPGYESSLGLALSTTSLDDFPNLSSGAVPKKLLKNVFVSDGKYSNSCILIYFNNEK